MGLYLWLPGLNHDGPHYFLITIIVNTSYHITDTNRGIFYTIPRCDPCLTQPYLRPVERCFIFLCHEAEHSKEHTAYQISREHSCWGELPMSTAGRAVSTAPWPAPPPDLPPSPYSCIFSPSTLRNSPRLSGGCLDAVKFCFSKKNVLVWIPCNVIYSLLNVVIRYLWIWLWFQTKIKYFKVSFCFLLVCFGSCAIQELSDPSMVRRSQTIFKLLSKTLHIILSSQINRFSLPCKKARILISVCMLFNTHKPNSHY